MWKGEKDPREMHEQGVYMGKVNYAAELLSKATETTNVAVGYPFLLNFISNNSKTPSLSRFLRQSIISPDMTH